MLPTSYISSPAKNALGYGIARLDGHWCRLRTVLQRSTNAQDTGRAIKGKAFVVLFSSSSHQQPNPLLFSSLVFQPTSNLLSRQTIYQSPNMLAQSLLLIAGAALVAAAPAAVGTVTCDKVHSGVLKVILVLKIRSQLSFG